MPACLCNAYKLNDYLHSVRKYSQMPFWACSMPRPLSSMENSRPTRTSSLNTVVSMISRGILWSRDLRRDVSCRQSSQFWRLRNKMTREGEWTVPRWEVRSNTCSIMSVRREVALGIQRATIGTQESMRFTNCSATEVLSDLSLLWCLLLWNHISSHQQSSSLAQWPKA